MKFKPLLIILISAFLVRFMGFWVASYYVDEATLLHRAKLIVSGEELFNPHFDSTMIAYGMVVSYLQAFFMKGTYLAGYFLQGWNSINDNFDQLRLAARFLSVLISTIGVYVVYLTAKKLFDRKVGLFSALVLAFSFGHVSIAKFALVDNYISFFLILSLFYAVLIFKEKETNLSNYFLCGFFSSLAFAVKYNFPVFIPFIASYSLKILSDNEVRKKPYLFIAKCFSKGSIVFVFSVIVTLLLVNPYFLINPSNYYWQLKTVLTASWNFPYGARDFDNIPNFIWYLVYMVKVGMYYPYFIFAAGGIVIAFTKFKKELFLLLSYPIIQFVLLEIYTPRSDRYPNWWLPMFAILAGLFISYFFNYLNKINKGRKGFFLVFILLMIIPIIKVVFYSLDITFNTDTRLQTKSFFIDHPAFTYFILDIDGKGFFGNNQQIISSHELIIKTLDKTSPSPYNIYRYPGEYLVLSSFIYGEDLHTDAFNHEGRIFHSRPPETTKVLEFYLKQAKLLSSFIKDNKKLRVYSRFGFNNGFFDSIRLYGGGTDIGNSYNPTILIYKIPEISERIPSVVVNYCLEPGVGDCESGEGLRGVSNYSNDGLFGNRRVIDLGLIKDKIEIISAPTNPFPKGEYFVEVSFRLKNPKIIRSQKYGELFFGDEKFKDDKSQKEIYGYHIKKTDQYQKLSFVFKKDQSTLSKIVLKWLGKTEAKLETITLKQINK